MSRLEDLDKALERTDERSSDYARFKEQRDDLQEDIHGLQAAGSPPDGIRWAEY
jgi:chromosome segregation ATPase